MKEVVAADSYKCAIESDKSNSVVEIKDLVTLMIKDSVLIRRWTEFSDFLHSEPQDKAKWERGINNLNLRHYEVFSEMLNNWVLRSDHSGTLSSTKNFKGRTVQDLCYILRETMNCNTVAENLEQHFEKCSFIATPVHHVPPKIINKIIQRGKNHELKWPITHGLKKSAQNFSGRKSELKKLNSYFRNLNSYSTNVVLVCGIGGIGKTELCRKFANNIFCYKLVRIKIRRLNCSISRVWLHGDSLDSLRNSVLQLARELEVKTDADVSLSEYFEYLASLILQNCSRLLVIIDNVDVKYPEMTKVVKIIQLTKYVKQIFVVVTSRNSMVLERAGYTMELDVLSKEQARNMLKMSCEFFTNSDANELCKLVQYFPLALQQAVAYINQQRNHFRTPNYNVSNYIQEFEVKKSEMLDQRLNEFEHEYSMTTLFTWDMTISKMKHGAVEILKILSYLEPDGVEFDFLENICKKRCTDFESSLTMLYNYSLVKIENSVLSIHRLVQEVMRRKVQNPTEYSKGLFKTVLFECTKFDTFSKGGPTRTELVQLNCVGKFAWNCELGIIDNHFHELLLFLLDKDMIDCAVEYMQRHNFQCIQLISDNFDRIELGDKKIVRLILWGIFHLDEYEFVTNKLILRDDCSFPVDYKSLELGLKISRKYFGETNELTVAIQNQLSFTLSNNEEVHKDITVSRVLEDFTSFPYDLFTPNCKYSYAPKRMFRLCNKVKSKSLLKPDESSDDIEKSVDFDVNAWLKQNLPSIIEYDISVSEGSS